MHGRMDGRERGAPRATRERGSRSRLTTTTVMVMVMVILIAFTVIPSARAHARYADAGCDASAHPRSARGEHGAPTTTSAISFALYWCDERGSDERGAGENEPGREMSASLRVGEGETYAPGRRLTLAVDVGGEASEILLTTSAGTLEDIGANEDEDVTKNGPMVSARKCEKGTRANPNVRAKRHVFIWRAPTEAEDVVVRVTAASGEYAPFQYATVTFRRDASLRAPAESGNATEPENGNSAAPPTAPPTASTEDNSKNDEESHSIAAFIAHGVMMFIAFGVFAPAAVAWSRFGRPGEGQPPSSAWLRWHMSLMIAAVVLVAMSAFVAIGEINERGATHLDSAHTKWGVALMFIIGFQPINGYLRPPNADALAKTAARISWEWLHKGLGYFALLAGACTACTGIIALSEHDETVPVRYYIGLIVVYAASLVGFFAFAAFRARASEKTSSRAAFVELSAVDVDADADADADAYPGLIPPPSPSSVRSRSQT